MAGKDNRKQAVHRATNAKKNQPRSAEARRLVLEATKNLIASEGISNATTANIAKAAGVTTGVLQYQFGSKQNIFEAIIVDNISSLSAQLGRFNFEGSSEQPLLASALDLLWEYYAAADYRAVMEVLLNHATESDIYIEAAIKARDVLHTFLSDVYRASGYKLPQSKADSISEVALTALRGMSVTNGIFPTHQNDFTVQRLILADSLLLYLTEGKS